MSSWKYSDPLITKHETCDKCSGDLAFSKDPPAEVTLYTREGTKYVQHYTKICSNRWCLKRFKYGYVTQDDKKVYIPLDPTTKYLVSSDETAFSVEYLYEATLHILHSNASFEGLSDVYNQFHNFSRENILRSNLNPKRLASGLFLYAFLEMTSRNNISPVFEMKKNWLDTKMLEELPALKQEFLKFWCSKHKCDVENCETMMVTDGGMQANRKICAAKFSVVRQFQHSNKTVLTGVCQYPAVHFVENI